MKGRDMAEIDNLLKKYVHKAEEFPVLMNQTHKIIRDKKTVTECININENIIHYLQDTAQLISEIDGSISNAEPYDHVVYLDKSARPVSWLVNMFWNDFAKKGTDGKPVTRPRHSYINIDRSPWFRNVGIDVSDDGRQKANGELATYSDFKKNIENLKEKHIAEIRALYIEGGIPSEDIDWVLNAPSILDKKRVLIVDEVYRTGSTLSIATTLFQKAFPDAKEFRGAYFWHPSEPPIMVGDETMLTSLPVWYDPDTLTGRGIGGIDEAYYRKRLEYYSEVFKENPSVDINKLRAQAFSASVYSAPLLNDDGTMLKLEDEKKTRELCRDLKKLYEDYKAGTLFFIPPYDWIESERFEEIIQIQGVKILPENATEAEREKIRRDPVFYINFVKRLKES